MSKPKKKSDFMDGENHRTVPESRRAEFAKLEQQAHDPLQLLRAAKISVGELHNIMSRSPTAVRKDLIANLGLSRAYVSSLSDAEAYLCHPTLGCMANADWWLDRGEFALERADKFLNTAATNTQYIVHAKDMFLRAVSYAFYAGLECCELKARVSYKDRHGKSEGRKEGALKPLALAAAERLREKHKNEPGFTSSAGGVLQEMKRDKTGAVREASKGVWQYKDGDRWTPFPKPLSFAVTWSRWMKEQRVNIKGIC